MLEPLKMHPVYKEPIWGGSNLKKKYGKDIPSDCTGEAWEVAAHKNGQSTVAGGAYDGKTLGEVVRTLGKELLGDFVADKYPDKFPLLVKFLDCNDKLSVQVHPDDVYAREHENGELGKTEMWYILDAKPGAKLIYGFSRDITREEFQSAIERGTLDDVMNYVEVEPGDCFFIPSKTLHALLDGLLVAEIQQNSDTTYRVYDFGRVDKNGNARELHIKKSVDVTNLASSKGGEKVVAQPEPVTGGVKYPLCKCDYFDTVKYEARGKISFETNRQSFELLIVYEGEATLSYEGGMLPLKAGDSVVVPAYLGSYQINGTCGFLKSTVPADGVI